MSTVGGMLTARLIAPANLWGDDAPLLAECLNDWLADAGNDDEPLVIVAPTLTAAGICTLSELAPTVSDRERVWFVVGAWPGDVYAACTDDNCKAAAKWLLDEDHDRRIVAPEKEAVAAAPKMKQRLWVCGDFMAVGSMSVSEESLASPDGVAVALELDWETAHLFDRVEELLGVCHNHTEPAIKRWLGYRIRANARAARPRTVEYVPLGRRRAAVGAA